MANIIELHMLRAYGVNSVSRGENGEAKSCSIGDVSRARFSSQSIKATIRKIFEDAYHTRHIADIVLVEKYKKDHPDAEPEDIEEMKVIFQFLSNTLKGDQIRVFSVAEADAIYECASEMIKDAEARKMVLAAISGGKAAKEYKKEDLDKKTSELTKKVQEYVERASLGLDISIFGRMSTDGPVETIPSSTHVNHAYSIDENHLEDDFFTAFDNVFDQSAILRPSSFTSNTMYSYMNIDPVQVFRNLMMPVEKAGITGEEYKEKCEENKKIAIDGIVRMIELMIQSVPEGKQNSMASYPMPSIVYATMDSHTYPCTFDPCFNKVVRSYGNQSVAAIGAERMMKYAAKTADEHEYRCFFMDSMIEDEISGETISLVEEEGISHDSLKNRNKLFEEVRMFSEKSISQSIMNQ